MDRRIFLKYAGLAFLMPPMASCANAEKKKNAPSGSGDSIISNGPDENITPEKNEAAVPEKNETAIEESAPEKFKEIMQKALAENWSDLPIGDLTAKIGLEFLAVPYVPWTLEGGPREQCTINLEGLDCVTFFENSLCMARIIKKGRYSYAAMVEEVTFTRYRGGKLTDYTSRLHYTADWLFDNEQKGVVKNLSERLGGVKFPYDVFFMSENWKFYAALKRDKSMIPVIKKIENTINSRDYYYIPTEGIPKIEKYINSGDIIGLATNKKGLDYAHTALAYVDADGSARMLHASSKAKKVLLGEPIYDYARQVKSNIGISIARPLPV